MGCRCTTDRHQALCFTSGDRQMESVALYTYLVLETDQ